ncbi:hypothetical protein BGZ90_008196, partial [Linnemannia elongata]
VKLSEIQFFETDRETQDAPGASWSIGGDPRPHDHKILFNNLADLTNPIARCGSDIWEKNKKTATQAQPWYHPFTRDRMQVAQVGEIKHYPEDSFKDNFFHPSHHLPAFPTSFFDHNFYLLLQPPSFLNSSFNHPYYVYLQSPPPITTSAFIHYRYIPSLTTATFLQPLPTLLHFHYVPSFTTSTYFYHSGSFSPKISLNLRRLHQLSRNAESAPTALSDTIVSYDDPSYVQPPPPQDQLTAIQLQPGVLTIDTAPEQAHDQVDLLEEDDEEIEPELEEPQQ